MSHTKNRTTHDTPTSWKSSLLNKEESPVEQNPLNYFDQVVNDNDAFGNIWDYILDARDRKESPKFHLSSPVLPPEPIRAFMIVQDRRGVHLICPLFVLDGFIAHEVRPLKLDGEDPIDAVLADSIGAVCIDHDEYVLACSRGFENASTLLLGGKAVELKPDYRVVSVFYVTP